MYCYEPAIAFYQVMNDEFIPACLAGDADKANELARGAMRRHYETHRKSIDQVVAMASTQASSDEAEAAAVVSSRTAMSIISSFVVLGVIGIFGWYTARETINPLRGSATRLQFLSKNDMTNVSHRLRRNAENASDQATMASGCLLYTSPSPRDATLSRMPSSA